MLTRVWLTKYPREQFMKDEYERPPLLKQVGVS